jgi:hypothetical protein
MRKNFLPLFLLQCFFNNLLFSQNGPADSASASPALQNTIDFYYTITGENAHLYSGSEYVMANSAVIGHPYFDTTAMVNGSIYFSGTLYKNVPLLYDILHDDIIINKYNQNYFIRLPGEKIAFFSISKDTFVRVVPDSANKALPGIGFYDRIYNGRTEVIVKRKKVLNEDPPANGVSQFHYLQRNSYFVKKQHIYFQVSSRKSLLKLFDDKNKDIRRYLRKNKINFKDQPEYAILQASKYYDLLTN